MKRALFPLVIVALTLVGAGCLNGQPKMTPVTLEYWRMEDDPSDLDPVIAAYRETHPQVTVNVTRFPREDYRKTLLTALAEGRGPDMFNVPHAWLRGWMKKISPMPAERSVVERTADESGQPVNVVRKKPAMSLLQLDRDFAEVAAKAVVFEVITDEKANTRERQVFALPFSADTLAMYYNRDLLRNANIGEPPKTWAQLQEQAAILSRKGEDGKLEQSGAALGWSNVGRNTELLAALMAQNGAPMNNAGRPYFWSAPAKWDRGTLPGVEALGFYRSFSDPNSSNRSWDRDFSNDLDTFIAGRTAYYFGLPEDAKRIRAMAPRLDLGVAPLPQIKADRRINIPLFPVETVSKDSRYPGYAWDFLEFAASADQVRGFLSSSGRPAALRDLIEEQRGDAAVGPFVGQVLTAESWYLGYDYAKTESLFRDMVETEPSRENTYVKILTEYGSQVSRTYVAPNY
ncbi:extracellular solute-binding protein [Candidatus Uhrbacteria bacterium]|nr:extracellular solute-binding protein [Candidatus Uhrbacteria bacterium]